MHRRWHTSEDTKSASNHVSDLQGGIRLTIREIIHADGTAWDTLGVVPAIEAAIEVRGSDEPSLVRVQSLVV